ncbi:MAG: beta-propeller domain-containing protein [Myxococcota bacterium]
MKRRWLRNGFTASAAVLAVTALSACTSDSDDALAVAPRTRTTAQLRQFESCTGLHDRLKGNLKEESRVQLLQYLNDDYFGGFGGVAESADTTAQADGANAAPAARQEGVDFSGTNNQEAGVDESDFVKTDGFHIYVLNGNRLEVFGTPEFGDLVAESSFEVEGVPASMLMSDDRIAIFSTIYPWSLPEAHPLREYVGETGGDGWYYYGEILSKVTVLNRSDLSLVRELYMEGWQQTARRIGTSVRTVSYTYRNVPGLVYWPDLPEDYWQIRDDDERKSIMEAAVRRTIAQNDVTIDNSSLSDFVPMVLERRPEGNIIRHSATDGGCTNFAIADDGASHGLTSILTFDLKNVDARFESDHIVTNRSQVYASQDALIIAEHAQDWWWFWSNDDFDEATNIHWFDISENGMTTYSASGRVPGTIRDQFSLSEHNGFVRVASTVGRWNRWWLPEEEQEGPLNYVYVLDQTPEGLALVGETPGLAEGEQIWSSRFVGDKAYLVTFRNVDPLFTIDLADPTAPKVIGELKIAGVSTYIHPLDDGEHLLTIGIAGDDDGLFWGQTQLSLFDVGDFANPALDDAMTLVPEVGDGWTYAYSEAQWEHKAFQYWAPKKVLGIPLSTHRWENRPNGEETYHYSTRLELIAVDEEAGTLRPYGAVDHSDFFNRDSDRWWSYRDVRRSIFMGDYVYAISDRGVTAHNLDTMQLAASEELDGEDFEMYWWW